MHKPVIIRLIGWVGWLFLLFLVAVVYTTPAETPAGGKMLALVFLGGVTLLCWGIWALVSAIVWIMRKQAATTAAILRDTHHVDVPQAPRVGAWPLTKLYCITHKTWVPAGALAQHDGPACLYVPNLPGRFGKAQPPGRPPTVSTSPLGLNQNR